MELKKIKDWAYDQSHKQFEILEHYSNGIIKVAKRIKDDAIFRSLYPIDICDSYADLFFVINFHDDMRHVDYEIHSFENKDKVKGTCEIDSIVLNEDCKVVEISQKTNFLCVAQTN